MTQTKESFFRKIKKYCSEDVSLIEGYAEFLADTSGQRWCCHHRREINEDGSFAHSRAELKELGLYYNRPASELILLPCSKHMSMHNGKGKSPEHHSKQSDAKKQYWADPEKCAKHGKAMNQYWSDPAHRANHGKAMKQYWADPAHRAERRKPKSDFGRKFQKHYETTKRDSPKLYTREHNYYHYHGKCSWE